MNKVHWTEIMSLGVNKLPSVQMFVPGGISYPIKGYLLGESRKNNPSRNFLVTFDRDYVLYYIDKRVVQALKLPDDDKPFRYVTSSLLLSIKERWCYKFPLDSTVDGLPCITLEQLGIDANEYRA